MEQISTIGYAEPGAEERIAEFLASGEKTALVDIRKNPRSRWYPRFNQSALQACYGKRYIHLPEFGNVNYAPENRANGIVLANPSEGLRQVQRLLAHGWSIMLLCACKEYEQCHRKTVYDLIVSSINEAEARERRRLFISLMRRPEMRLVRLALRHINWCAGIDWRDIEEVWIDPLHDLKSCWSLDTPEYFVQCFCPDVNTLTYDDFMLWYRCTGQLGCKCYFCSYE